jgi:3-deoxy-D-manno-octulosonic-acid transferase
MRALYNVLFAVFFCLSAPYYFWKMRRRGNWRSGFRERFGRYGTSLKHAVTNRRVLWIHAVSVGEVRLCPQLIRALEQRLPNLKIVVSTTTSTGMEELHKRLPNHVEKVYYPLDFRGCVARALAIIHPDAVVLVEAEVWPNFLWKLRERHTPVFLVNARLSARSYRGYRRFGFLFRRLFGTLKGVGAQNEADAARLFELGCSREAVQVVGALKFDTAKLDDRGSLDVSMLMRQIGVAEDTPILLGGSTHAGEEVLLAEIYQRLRARHPRLFLVLVPRHFERGKEIGLDLSARGVKFIYRREITSATHLEPGTVQCLLVNTTGELKYFYQQATVVFVGKSLTAEGGQNPIEPGALGKAMVFGPNMQNFEVIAARFAEGGGAVQVQNAAELERVLDELLGDAPRRVELGRRALQIVKANTGAMERTAEMIASHLRRLEGIGTPVPG